MADESKIIPSTLSPEEIETVKTFQQTGDKNTYVHHADIVNVNIIKTEESEDRSSQATSYYKQHAISNADNVLLEDFKHDYAEIMEYCINTDFSAELVRITLSDEIDILYRDKWRFKSRDFENKDLRLLKNRILKVLNELTKYLSPEYLRFHENSGMLIFRNQSWEEGCRLREDFQPNSLRLRQEIADLYRELYYDQFAEEDELLREEKDE
ncbi:MAG: hypothetical protein NC305_11095 [Lachnospiraceae bacterium]|nr:hypothetical protein [Muribaculaceae bacterium]MCM1411079.1 hypothetical protein [Lachnospiraceae bacterium]